VSEATLWTGGDNGTILDKCRGWIWHVKMMVCEFLFPSSVIPYCAGERDTWNNDFDCGYSPCCDCEKCLCNYHIGGTIHPITAKQSSKFVTRLIYGKPKGLKC